MPDQTNKAATEIRQDTPEEELPDPALSARQHLAARLSIRPPAGSRIKLDWNLGYPRLVIPRYKNKKLYYFTGVLDLISGIIMVLLSAMISYFLIFESGVSCLLDILCWIVAIRLVRFSCPQTFLLKKDHIQFDSGRSQASFYKIVYGILNSDLCLDYFLNSRTKRTFSPPSQMQLKLGRQRKGSFFISQ